jgi:hypothetical protein
LRVCDGVPTWGPCYPRSTVSQVLNIMPNSVLLNGEITSNGSSNIIEKGFVWDTVSSLDISCLNKVIISDTGSKLSQLISGLIPNKRYYVKVFAKNSVGYGLSPAFSFETLPKPTFLQVGSNYAGGVVAVLYSGGPGVDYHGIIATTTSYGGDWNTAVNNSRSLVVNGYEDWYLPGQGELISMCQNQTATGGYSPNSYWCNLENGNLGGYVEFHWGCGSAVNLLKTIGLGFRPIRTF